MPRVFSLRKYIAIYGNAPLWAMQCDGAEVVKRKPISDGYVSVCGDYVVGPDGRHYGVFPQWTEA